ncbi:Similar to Zasp52: PDZ and LIM domain protein Zasp (Drosophila melanogaster) [Cotesia congregata]|uniref:Similar to Zasp52: PDZ and LIM domain protein Zasp (Drosophila melanogaster) n=1 Tax=Cotesia congregata TaxID=51543 RepID=A0A8J2HUD9_COTCN|nr:Similar to Zasp52: PDZ and LIM domain protein Zasp (Drosophila melanogaster) [Cotesia congregata]
MKALTTAPTRPYLPLQPSNMQTGSQHYQEDNSCSTKTMYSSEVRYEETSRSFPPPPQPPQPYIPRPGSPFAEAKHQLSHPSVLNTHLSVSTQSKAARICAYCGKIFGNSPFFLEEGLPYCEADWNELFTTKCFACGFPVEADDRWVEALNNNYHSQCFNCTMCKKNFKGQSFYAKAGRPLCKNHAR